MRCVLLLAVVACGPAAAPLPPVAAPDPAPTQPSPSPSQVELSPPDDRAFLVECRGFIAKARGELQALLDDQAKPAVETTLEGFNELLRAGSAAASMARLAYEVHPDAKLRDAGRRCEREYSELYSELFLDKRVYDAIKAVDLGKADAATKRFATDLIRDYQRAGITLDGKQRDRMMEISEQITDVGQQIHTAIAGDTRFIEVTGVARLAGMPEDWIAAHPPDAKGIIKITTEYPDYGPFSSYANDDELRKQLYIKFRSRADATNEAAIRKLLVLRAEKAKLLGFKDWADYQSDDNMLRGGKHAQQFIERITALARTRAKQDYAELLAQLKQHDPKATAVADWQKAWLETQVKKQKYAVDAAAVRDYFAYDKVLAGLLDVTAAIYDVQYQPVTDSRTWHPDVKVFDVMRKGDKLGRIFLDMHPRPDKYNHAAMFPMRDGLAGKQLPEGALVCNFPNPRTSAPALMEHADVVTMFHEFGHLMHQVLGGNQRWISQSGIATERDFVEAPSQMFEEWGWSYETLSRFAKHHKTGEVIPRDLVAKLSKSRRFGIGLWTVQQMFYAAISLHFHQVDPKPLDQLATLKKLQAKYTPFAYVAGTKLHTSFGHLVDYSSMYYTYMWSLVIAKDLLTPFEQAGLMTTTTTYKYRDKILAAGGTKDAAELVRDFLGRDYDFKAYEKYLAE